MKRILPIVCLTVFAWVFSPGCAAKRPDRTPKLDAAGIEKTFDLPPKELLARAKTAAGQPPLSLTVESEQNGAFVTGWQRFRGEWHIGRYWQEQTRYRIAVVPDFEKPTEKSRLQVTQETQERAAEGQRWRNTKLPRDERAAKVLEQLSNTIR